MGCICARNGSLRPEWGAIGLENGSLRLEWGAFGLENGSLSLEWGAFGLENGSLSSSHTFLHGTVRNCAQHCAQLCTELCRIVLNLDLAGNDLHFKVDLSHLLPNRMQEMSAKKAVQADEEIVAKGTKTKQK